MWELTGAVLLLVPFAAGVQLPNILKECIPEDYVRNNSSANVKHSTLEGPQDYSRYHANDTLIGQPVLCTHQEKLCMQYNMLYNGDRCVDSKYGDIDLSSCHLLPAGRRVVYEFLCDGYVMAYDGQCYPKNMIRDVICGCDAEPTFHFIHGVECRCSPPTPIHVEQPAEEGHCRIPDLRFPDKDRSRFYRNPFEDIQGFTSKPHSLIVSNPLPSFNCSAEQLRCFEQGKVWMAGAGSQAEGCFELLNRGPCPEEHVVALDVQAALKGHVVTTCTHVRGGCPPGLVRLLFDGNCHNKSDVEVVTRGKIVANQFGILIDVTSITTSLEFRPLKVADTKLNAADMCGVDVQWFNSFRPHSVTRGIPVKSRRFEVYVPNLPRPER